MAANQAWVPLLLVAFTAVFRAWTLAIKPPHFDEGINGWFVDQMVKDGYYSYDPANYHGPLHFYILFLFKALFGRNLWALRMPTVIISTLTVWLVTRFDRFIDRRACWLAALAMAVSPAMEFYGRYAIHEAEMVFFLILAVWGGAGIWRYGGMQYVWAAALGATGMVLTKETYIIHFVAFALAFPALFVLEIISPSDDSFPRARNVSYSPLDLGAVALVCLSLIIFFYSGNFLDFPLLKGLYQTFAEWINTGTKGKSGHEKDWWYWFKLVAEYEWPVIAGMAFTVCYIIPKSNRLIRYLMIYGWGAFTAYSIVSYKTPWCIITIMWPFLFVFGHFFIAFVGKLPDKILWFATSAMVAAPLLFSSFYLSDRLSFYRYVEESEDYVYVQTFKDIDKLTGPVFTLVARDRSNYNMKGHVIMDSAYPLPWVLGDFDRVGYYESTGENRLPDPDDMDADFLVVDDDRQDDVEKLLKEDYFTEPFHLRASQDPVTLYLNYKTFHDLFPGRKPDFVQGVPVQSHKGDDDSL